MIWQPTEGRARQGGLRIGEMERVLRVSLFVHNLLPHTERERHVTCDCLIAHGATALMGERLL